MKPSFPLDFSVNESMWDRAAMFCSNSKVNFIAHTNTSLLLYDVDQNQEST